jgi:hypothetical protein
MLGCVPLPEGYEDIRGIGPCLSATASITDSELTSVHSPQHRGNEFVNSKTLLDKWNKSRDLAFVIGRSP